MAALTSQDITWNLSNRTPSQCIAFFSKYDKEIRRDVGHSAVDIFLKEIEAYFQNTTLVAQRRLDCARVAVLATGSLSQVKACEWHVIPEVELLIDVFDTFKPDWADEWVLHMVNENPYIVPHLHWLWDAGLCKRPRSEGYFHALLITPLFIDWPVETSVFRGKPALSDPRLATNPTKQAQLIEDLWQFFEIKGKGLFSLGDPDVGSSWQQAFLELYDAGHISRDRIMDASLAALSRDFNQPQARWYARLYEAMKPTPSEQHEHTERLLALLSSDTSPTVTFALNAIKRVDEAFPIQSKDLIVAIAPVMQSKPKGAVLAGIGLIIDAVRRDPDTQQAAYTVVSRALAHEKRDVQVAAIDALTALRAAKSASGSLSPTAPEDEREI
ncbi:MAG: DUF6493 family protein [Pseudomonadota bacterium]